MASRPHPSQGQPPGGRFGVISGAHPRGQSGDRALVSHLESQDILTRVLLNPLCVRASVHYLSSTEDCDQLIDGIRDFLG